MRADASRSALAELRRLAGLLQTGLLALDDAGVAREQPGLLQRRTVRLEVDGVQAPGHAETQRAGLTGDPTAVDAGDHVEPVDQVGGDERLADHLLVQLVREVLVQRATVDGPLAGAGNDANTSDGLLATAGRSSGSDRRRARRGVLGRSTLGAVGDALLV